ncbi:MAG: hypothetical protein DRH15_14670 [Deltaproteobacteria bacterium]|nr:MAG: hypothetical protein DRH15_14670 [Deltaproteobacteria bacterium]
MDKGKYLIGEVAEISGVSQKCIRSWEDYLGDVFRIQCGRMKYRYYTEEQLEIVKKIKQFLDEGFKLKFAVERAKEALS